MRLAVLPMLALTTFVGLTLPACGWFATPDPVETQTEPPPTEVEEDPAANMPKCRPASAVQQRGKIPYTVGESTPGGWAVTAVEAENFEFIRVGFSKGGTETMIEIAYNEGEEGDWATASYRLMPAPEHEPPPDLLKEAIENLRAWQASHGDDPFVMKKEGVIDEYDGLPPCGPDGKPL